MIGNNKLPRLFSGREEVIVTPIDPSKIGELLMNEVRSHVPFSCL